MLLKNKYLIITADDYGMTSKVSKGIRESIKNGLVSCTSVLMNYVSPEDSVLLNELKKTYKIGVGLHFNLSTGKSLSTNSDFNYEQLNNLDFIQKELRFQIDEFNLIYGDIDHINFHRHLHFDLRVLQEFLLIDEIKDLPVRYVNKLMRNILILNGRKTPDTFVNVFPYKTKPTNFSGLLKNALNDFNFGENGITEWMVHPGYSSVELENIAPNYSKRREEELRLLCEDSTKNLFKQYNINCKIFAECF